MFNIFIFCCFEARVVAFLCTLFQSRSTRNILIIFKISSENIGKVILKILLLLYFHFSSIGEYFWHPSVRVGRKKAASVWIKIKSNYLRNCRFLLRNIFRLNAFRRIYCEVGNFISIVCHCACLH